MKTFAQFICESNNTETITRADIFAIRKKIGKTFRDGKEALAKRLRVTPSSITTNLPTLSSNITKATSVIYVDPSNKRQTVGLGLDWFELNKKHIHKVMEDVYGSALAEIGYKFQSIKAEKRSWEYGKLHHQLLIFISIEKL